MYVYLDNRQNEPLVSNTWWLITIEILLSVAQFSHTNCNSSTTRTDLTRVVVSLHHQRSRGPREEKQRIVRSTRARVRRSRLKSVDTIHRRFRCANSPNLDSFSRRVPAIRGRRSRKRFANKKQTGRATPHVSARAVRVHDGPRVLRQLRKNEVVLYLGRTPRSCSLASVRWFDEVPTMLMGRQTVSCQA